MPIASSLITDAEIVLQGLMLAGGTDAVDTINVFTYKRTTVTADSDKVALYTIFGTTIVAPLKACLNERWSLARIRIRWLNDAEDSYADFQLAAQGLITGDSMPSDKCAYCLIRTGIRGKAFRGGKFFGPVSESDTTTQGDVFNAAALTRLNSLATAMVGTLTDSEGNVWYPTVVSRGGTPPRSQLKTNPTTVTSTKVLEVLVNKRVGCLARRRTRSMY